MAHSTAQTPTQSQVWIDHGRLLWANRPDLQQVTLAPPGPNLIESVRNHTCWIVVMLYLLLNWGFQQVRIPPVGGGGLPTAELTLLLFFMTTHAPRVLARLGSQVFLLPFLMWWGFGLGRLAFDVAGAGFWAIRDAAHVIESMFLLVGFVVFSHPSMMEKFFRWLPRILFIGAVYFLFYPVRDFFSLISPHIVSVNGFSVPIIGFMINSTYVSIMTGCYLLLFHGRNGIAVMAAMVLMAYPLAVYQARTLYVVLIALFAFLIFFRRSSTGYAFVFFALGAFALAMITLVGVQVEGRLGASVSPEFLLNHFLAIFGICNTDLPGVCAAAAGVDQRLDWWQNIFDQMLADPFKLLLGLGYGVVLTDHYGNSGVTVREPHNSYITIVARTGIIGICCWVSMMGLLIHRWYKTYRHCLALDWREGQNRLLVLMVFFICMWVLATGQDAFEKPYNIVPFYFFWGVVLRMGLQLEQGQIGPPPIEPEDEAALTGRRQEQLVPSLSPLRRDLT